MQWHEKIAWYIATLVIGSIVIFGFIDRATAENVRLPLWGNTDTRLVTWHSDTADNGDIITHADNYHWDTIAMVGFKRTDGVRDQDMNFAGRERNVWQFDGFKLYLQIPELSAVCSTRVHFNIGTDDTIYSTLHDSSEGGGIDKIYDFFDWFDSDSMGFMDRFEIELILGDTIIKDAAEYDRTILVRGALFGKD